MYLTLYRKYRPNNFDEVIGQTHITTTLKNQIMSGNVAHAYLFCGTRGTGKTSIAKIFARSINCEHPVNGNPCGKCKTCLALSQSNNIDILEIDAASNNKVDEIRDLRENVKYPPVNGKYKVYIIDEVHMLTDSAFNALLKTLEEPPQYVVFILATTEVQKLPATILSRCLRFDFKLLTESELEAHLEHIFKDSFVKYEKEAVQLIARLGQGSVRDMLSIADTVVAYSNSNVTYNAVLESVGAIDKKMLFNLGESILKNDAGNIINGINTILKLGKNVTQISKDLCEYFRDLAVILSAENYDSILNYPKDLLNELAKVSKQHSIDEILDCLTAFSSLENEFRNSTNPRLVLEVCALTLKKQQNINSLENRITRLEKSNEAEKKSHKTADIVLPCPSVVKKVDDNSITEEELDDDNDIQNSQNILLKAELVSDKVADVFKTNSDTQNDEAKEIFGKLLVALRQNHEFVLHSALGENVEAKMENNIFTFTVSDEAKYNRLNDELNRTTLNKLLNDIKPDISFEVVLNAAPKSKDVEKKLSEMFGNILKIE